MPFGPISLLVPRFKASKLNQNPIFEMASRKMGFKTGGEALSMLFTYGYGFTLNAVEKFKRYVRLLGLARAKRFVGINTLCLRCF